MMEEEQKEEKVLLEWEAPERVFVRRDKKYFQNLFATLLILAAVAVFFKEFLLAAVLGGFGFLQYALGTTPPRRISHRITTHHLEAHGHKYFWDELDGFWFSGEKEELTLNVETKHFYPRRLFLLLENQDKKDVAAVLKRFIPLKKRPPEDFLDRASSKLSRYLHL